MNAVEGSDVAVSGGPAPTGALSPASCSFGTLTHALGVASAVAGGAEVIATGAAGGTMTFTEQGTGNSEVFPLVVATGVTLKTDPGSVGTYEIDFSDANDTLALRAAGTAAVNGFSIQNTGNRKAVAVSCSSWGPSFTGLVIGSPSLQWVNAYDIADTCGASIDTSTITQTSGPAILLESSGSTSVTSATITGTASGVQVNAGTATLTSLSVSSTEAEGLQVGTAAGLSTPTVSLSNSTFTSCGAGAAAGGTTATVLVNVGTLDDVSSTIDLAAKHGVQVVGGTVSLTGTLIENSAKTGLMATGGTVTGSQVSITGSALGGVTLTAATVTLSAPTISGNLTGVDVQDNAGALTLHGAYVANNTGWGAYLNGGSLTIDQPSLFDTNGQGVTAAAIRADQGTLSIAGSTDGGVGVDGGQVEVSNSGNFGLRIVAATSTVTGMYIHGGANNSGIDIGAATATNVQNAGESIQLTDLTVSNNQGEGINVHAALPNNTAPSLSIATSTITGNAGVGVQFSDTDGQISATLSGCSVSANTNTGVVVDQNNAGTSVSMLSDDIFGNATGQPNTKNHAGGIGLKGGSLTTFSLNTVHGNLGDQVFANGASSGLVATWDLSGSLCPSTGVPGLSNSFYCYGGGGSTAVGVRASGTVSVQADLDSWQADPPVSGTDYAGTLVTVSNACSASTATCP